MIKDVASGKLLGNMAICSLLQSFNGCQTVSFLRVPYIFWFVKGFFFPFYAAKVCFSHYTVIQVHNLRFVSEVLA